MKESFEKTKTVKFLDALLMFSQVLLEYSIDRKNVYKILYGIKDQDWTTEKICRFIQSMKQRNYIEIENNGNGESIRFTNKAKLKLIDKIVAKHGISDSFCFVSFDIPEDMKNLRNLFRRTIKRMGFRQVQKSLWVINKNVGDLVEMAAKEYNVSDYIVYLVSDASNIDNTIKEMFTKRKNNNTRECKKC